MVFNNLMKEVLNGSKMTRELWDNDSFFVYLKDGLLYLHKDDGKDYAWFISKEDLEAKDWVKLLE